MRPTNVIWLGVAPILGAWLGCNTIIGLELGEPEETGSGGDAPSGASSSSAQGTGTGATTGSSGGGGAGGSTECAGSQLPAYDPTCQVCIDASCCEEVVACSVDPDCIALLGCESMCQGDSTCIAACGAESPVGGLALRNALASCLGGPCGPACGVDPGTPVCDSGFVLSGTDAAIQECAACLGAPVCCDAFKDCFANATCQACIYLEEQAECDASQLDESIYDCFLTTCAAACQ